MMHRNNAALILLLVLLSTIGCRQAVRERLVGRWEGRPDSAEASRARQKFAAEERDGDSEKEGESPSKPDAASATDPPVRTLLEGYDIRITLELGRDGSVVMWRDDGQERLTGSWRVLESQGRRAQLQFSVAGEANEPSPNEVRNFKIEFDADHDGFTLAEQGADPQFGALYFQRVGE